MDNSACGIRACGEYAMLDGREYFGSSFGDCMTLLTDEDPLPSGFEPSKKTWVRGEAVVQLADVQRVFQVRTTCIWRGHRFTVGIILDGIANVTYLGVDFDTVCRLPGMERPDKYEVRGEIPVSELTEVEECEQVQGSEQAFADALRVRMRKGCGLSYPYARRCEIAGLEATHSLHSYPHDGLLTVGRALAAQRSLVFAATERLIVDGYPKAFWVAADRSTRVDGPPNDYLLGWEGEQIPRYVGNAAEVIAEMIHRWEDRIPQVPSKPDVQIGFPGRPESAHTYVGSWRWNVHGEATVDQFVLRAASATQEAIDASRARELSADPVEHTPE
jgi:hypothetical protein